MEEASVNNTIHLSGLLAERRGEILERWTHRIAWEHQDKELSRGELRDHLPLFFDKVLEALGAEGAFSADAPTSVRKAASAAHGAQRLRVGFDLAEVIREYEILTECILDEVEAVGGAVSMQALRRLQALLDGGRRHAVSAYIDRRDMEVRREHAQHVAFIAHELRNPLMTAFMATTELQRKERSEDKWALDMLARNLGDLRELINQVLIADRLAGGVQIKCEPLDLRTLLDQAVADNRLAAERRQIELKLEAPDKLPFSGDRRLLRSAISNLLVNAVKFTQDNKCITVRAAPRDRGIAIEVEDRCGGLPGDNIEELFEPFVQRGENRTGFGLGLAIVKQAAEAHGGKVQVRNLPGRGCVFSLELPAA
jgi:signal transduction histidine kinase